jgi:hypothetical protein
VFLTSGDADDAALADRLKEAGIGVAIGPCG